MDACLDQADEVGSGDGQRDIDNTIKQLLLDPMAFTDRLLFNLQFLSDPSAIAGFGSSIRLSALSPRVTHPQTSRQKSHFQPIGW